VQGLCGSGHRLLQASKGSVEAVGFYAPGVGSGAGNGFVVNEAVENFVNEFYVYIDIVGDRFCAEGVLVIKVKQFAINFPNKLWVLKITEGVLR
jgi:hypothetical protein